MGRKLLRPTSEQRIWRVVHSLCLWCGGHRTNPRNLYCDRSCRVSAQNSDRAARKRKESQS